MTVTLTLSLRGRRRDPLPLRARRMTLMMTRSRSAEGAPEACGRTLSRDLLTLRSEGWWRVCSLSLECAWRSYCERWADGVPDIEDRAGRGPARKAGGGVMPQVFRRLCPAGFSSHELTLALRSSCFFPVLWLL